MKSIPEEIEQFFYRQGFVIVSTVDNDGTVHNACKDIVDIKRTGKIYLLDLYRGHTYANIKKNAHISIAAVDEHRFKGYCLKGRAVKLQDKELPQHLVNAWEERITARLTQRLLKNLKEEKGHPRHPEALMPNPQYMICMEVDEVVDLTPRHLK